MRRGTNLTCLSHGAALSSSAPTSTNIGKPPLTDVAAVLQVYPARPDLRPFHEAADLYLDPMPLGSLTALLEVAALGIPCVLLPRLFDIPIIPLRWGVIRFEPQL